MTFVLFSHSPPLNPISIDKFLVAAGNAEQFDHNATVDEALRKLGLPDLFTPMPGMEVALLAHQTIGVAWMLDRERGYAKGGKTANTISCFATRSLTHNHVQVFSQMIWVWARYATSCDNAATFARSDSFHYARFAQTVQL